MSSIYTSTSGMNPTVVESGLISGINTQQLISAELQPYQEPVTNLTNEQTTLNSNIGDYQQINSDIQALKTASMQLAVSSGWNARSATSSNSSAATATASAGTPLGSVSFSVTQLAAANSLVSAGSVSSTSQIVTSQAGILVSAGAAQLGFASLSAGSAVSLGSHAISVTQSSAAASATGTLSFASQASGINIVSGTNDTISVTVGTKSYNLVLGASATGGYSGSGLLSAVQSAITTAGAGGVLQAGYDSSGHLTLSTVDQGSTQSLSITGGDALGTLGLATGSSTGVDAVVNVDGTANTISTVVPGGAVSLTGSSGATFSATLIGSSSQSQVDSPLISSGSVTATDVSAGNGSLADVVSNINSANAGVVASAVQTGTNQYVLQLTSSVTGTDGNLSVDPNAFASSSLGSLKTAVAGQNAEIQIGGSSGYTVSSQTNTFQGLIPGLTVTAQQVTSSPVTVTVGSDTKAIASSVKSLVDSANTALSDLQKYAGYNAATKTGGPLMGSGVLENLVNQIESVFSTTAGSSNLGSPASIGIKLNGTQLSFDQSAFEAAYAANPAQVQNLFTQGGAFSPSSSNYTGQVGLVYASDTTQPGSYAIQVSQSASQATVSGAALASGAVSVGESLTVQMGSATATYTTSSGQTLNQVASGLNAAFAAQGMRLSAQVVPGTGGSQLQLRSDDYGSATSFSVSTTNSGAGSLGISSGTYAGTDVAGTINGVAATGDGQVLSAPSSDPTLGGLAVKVSASGISAPTPLGSFTYSAGLGQALSSLGYAYSDPATGSITQTITSLQNEATGLTPQINFYQSIVSQEQKLLMAEYATMEAQLGSLKNQSTSLASQLSKIAATSAPSSSGG